MLTYVDEAVEVVTVFKTNKVFPSILKWNGRIYKINKVNMVHKVWEGDILTHIFSVSDNTNFFRLLFNTSDLQWRLDQVYSEG